MGIVKLRSLDGERFFPMPELLFVRHGESEDNLKGIIQGPLNDSGLTERGRSHARAAAGLLLECGQGISGIYSSKAKRALETAEEISVVLGIPVNTDSSLREFNPGILSGMTKEKARLTNPEHLEKYLKRGDLDGIPGAETGDELQARSLIFLSRYLGQRQDSRYIAVSHAGLIRCSSNTAKNLPRETPLATPNGGVERVCDPWGKICHSRLYLAKSSDAYKITTPDSKYVLKLVSGKGLPYFEEQAKVHAVLSPTGRAQKLLAWKEGVQVLEYLDGDHKYGPLPQGDAAEIMDCAYAIKEALSGMSPAEKRVDLKRKIESSLENVPAESFSYAEIRRLLDDPRFLETLSEQVPVDYDWHRSNIIFDGRKASKLDPSIVYAPSDFQPASVILSAFMLEDEHADIASLSLAWPGGIVRPERLSLLLKARALIGTSFFERPDVPKTAENSETLSRYISAFSRADSY